MNIFAVEGAAGTGKTHGILNRLSGFLADHPLTPGQRVLALTFMHGSRQRLASRLSSVLGNVTPFDCITFDRLAYRIVTRWDTLARARGISHNDTYNGICAAAGLLLQDTSVQAWIAMTHPVVVIDELQDLSLERLAIVRGLAGKCAIIAAADEFQCLDSDLRPNPGVEWINAVSSPEILTVPHRTEDRSLLMAASDIRCGRPLKPGPNLEIVVPKGKGLAAYHLARLLSTRPAKTVALIAPSMTDYIRYMIGRVGQAPIGAKNAFGPHAIVRERRIDEQINAAQLALDLPEMVEIDELVLRMEKHLDAASSKQGIKWAERRRSVTGVALFERTAVHDALRRQAEVRANFSVRSGAQFSAMSVHQAKNREFGGVVVVWPYQVTGDDEHRRRLLYNAVTRAQHWCAIIIQSQVLRNKPPFL